MPSNLLALLDRLRIEISRTLTDSGYSGLLGGQREVDQAGFERLIEVLALLDPIVMQELDDEYQQVIPGSVQRMAHHIRQAASLT